MHCVSLQFPPSTRTARAWFPGSTHMESCTDIGNGVMYESSGATHC